jgi:hypothetical protein
MASLACCPVCLVFQCDESVQDNCHSGVGWIKARDATGSEIYNGCGSGNVLELACQARYPITVDIEYNHCEGPCAGSHVCDRAVFDVVLDSCTEETSCGQELGTINLNNGDCYRSGNDNCGRCCDECYRWGGTFVITESMVDNLRTCLAGQSSRTSRSLRVFNSIGGPDPSAENQAP